MNLEQVSTESAYFLEKYFASYVKRTGKTELTVSLTRLPVPAQMLILRPSQVSNRARPALSHRSPLALAPPHDSGRAHPRSVLSSLT